MTAARDRAESFFSRYGIESVRAAPPIDWSTLPPAIRDGWLNSSPRTCTVAWKIAAQRTMMARAMLWQEVPEIWRTEVAAAVSLLLGVRYGTLRPYTHMLLKIAAEVPADFVAPVIAQALRVYALQVPVHAGCNGAL